MNRPFWRQLHRWTGLLLSAAVIFYCLTGVLLNHRQYFGYFQDQRRSVTPVKISGQDGLETFIAAYKRQINRPDDPKVIRIKTGGVIEFLYGSHGRVTYTIDPAAATMTRVEKVDRQPWYWLNRLHKSYKTSRSWQVCTDAIALLIIFLTASGLVIFRYKHRDVLLLLSGLFLLAIGMLVG